MRKLTLVYKSFFKGLFDKLLAITFLIAMSPIFIVISLILCKLFSGKIFFTQNRLGQNLEYFKIIKFKTMNDSVDVYGKKLPDNQRVTKFGSFLRSTSLDEIPNLINVISGNMSLIGPRPIPVEYKEFLDLNHHSRFSVKPGISGLAQISGRNALTWKEKFELDLLYIEKVGLILDLHIFFRTLWAFIDFGPNKELGDISIDEFKPKFD
jgi:undecaprenyl phosphate N,N'-diacetylbacillosamine 1-phosphate transferase